MCLSVDFASMIEGQTRGRRICQRTLKKVPIEVALCFCSHDLIEVGVFAPRDVKRVLDMIAGGSLAEPHSFHLGHVPDQSQQGEVRRRDRPHGQLLCSKAATDVEQGLPLPCEKALEDRAIRTDQRTVGNLQGRRRDPGHGPSVLT